MNEKIVCLLTFIECGYAIILHFINVNPCRGYLLISATNCSENEQSVQKFIAMLGNSEAKLYYQSTLFKSKC